MQNAKHRTKEAERRTLQSAECMQRCDGRDLTGRRGGWLPPLPVMGMGLDSLTTTPGHRNIVKCTCLGFLLSPSLSGSLKARLYTCQRRNVTDTTTKTHAGTMTNRGQWRGNKDTHTHTQTHTHTHTHARRNAMTTAGSRPRLEGCSSVHSEFTWSPPHSLHPTQTPTPFQPL